MDARAASAPLDGVASRILIVGYFGLGVIGDEAILASMAASFGRTPGLHLTATSYAPPETRETHGVAAVRIEDLAEVLGALDEADLVLVGGGGVYNEYSPWQAGALFQKTPHFNVLCAAMPFLAWARGKPCMIYAAGVEPLYSDAARSQVLNAFRLAGVATVRDKGSAQVLEGIGCPLRLFRVTADPAFGIPRPGEGDLQALAERFGVDRSRPWVGVSLRHWNLERFDLGDRTNAWEDEVTAALQAYLAETDDQLLLLPFQKHPSGWIYADDTVVLRRVQARLPEGRCLLIDRQLRADEIVGLLSFCRMVLAMRFHSVVLAAVAGAPSVALSYSLKVDSAVQAVGLGDLSVPLDGMSASALLETLRRCRDDLAARRDVVASRARTMSERNEENVALALGLLAEDGCAPEPPSQALRAHTAALLDQFRTLLMRDGTTEALRSALRSLIPGLVSRTATLDDARVALETLVKACPDDPSFAYHYAFCEHSRGNYERAITHYERAMHAGFPPHWPLFHRGRCHRELGNHAQAAADLKAAVDCGGGSPAAARLAEWYPDGAHSE